MSTRSIDLPIVPGGTGAAVISSALSAQKTIIVSGVQGTIQVQGSSDGVNFCTIASFSGGGVEDSVVTLSAESMRVIAPNGSAASVCVTAEGSMVRSGVVPSPPVNGAGASLDISDFGPETTVYAMGIAAGTVGFEISCDGISWSPDFKNFSNDGCMSKNIDARYIRAIGNGSSATVGVSSEESALTALTSPPLGIVYRHGATGADAPGGNVYTTEDDMLAAIAATSHLGTRQLIIDSRYTTHLNGNGDPACPCTKPWDLTDVIVGNVPFSALDILEGGSLSNMVLFNGKVFYISYDGVTPGVIIPSPDIGGIGDIDSTLFVNYDVNAAPMFVVDGFMFIAGFGDGSIGDPAAPSVAPIVDLNDGFLVTSGLSTAGISDNAFIDTSVAKTGFVRWRFTNAGVQGNFPAYNYDFPLLAATVGFELLIENRSARLDVSPIIPDTSSPYQASFNELVQADTTVTPAAMTVNLPDTHGVAMGCRVVVKDAGGGSLANNITVAASGADTVEGAASVAIATNNEAVEFICDGLNTNWILVSRS